MKLRIALEEKEFDLRVRDRLLADGKLTKEEIKKYIDKLPDDAERSVALDSSEASKLQ